MPQSTSVNSTDSAQKRVQVWFGSEVISSHTARPDEANRYAALIARRFAGLTVTVDDAQGDRDPALAPELLWDQTVR
ncbi:MAG: hypothetical protein GEU93_21580 [Propionibacteriales bacterium]|nr:hypothetical protein [Propionibacteriales bacterium]